MIKLKKLLKEGFAWERKFGQPLPTLDDVQKKYQLKEFTSDALEDLLPYEDKIARALDDFQKQWKKSKLKSPKVEKTFKQIVALLDKMNKEMSNL